MIKERIIYEDNDMIVCHKPAGIATQTARVGQADMVSEISKYLAVSAGTVKAAGTARTAGTIHTARTTPYVGVVQRLDQPVEGIIVFAKNKQAAAALSRQITSNSVEKYYYAVICGRNLAPEGTLTDYLLKDDRANTTGIVPAETAGSKKAVLDYKIMEYMSYPAVLYHEDSTAETEHEEAAPQIAVVRIRLHTGRHHQIRVQMSHAGMSLVGDRKYADAETVLVSERMHIKEIALCAYKLSFTHPVSGKTMSFGIKPENKVFQTQYWQNYTGFIPHSGR